MDLVDAKYPLMKSRQHGISACLVLLLATLTVFSAIAGIGIMDSSDASATTKSTAALHASEASDCADRATGPVPDDFKLAVCTDLDSDLVGMAKLLGLPALAPTFSSLNSPVEVVFSEVPSPKGDDVSMETQYFSAGSPYNIEPCKVTLYPSAYTHESPVGNGVSLRLHVLLSHEAVHCYQNTVISFQEAGGNDSTIIPNWISEGSATYLATLYTDSAEPGTPTFWTNQNGWLGGPNINLTKRSYDAVGWYSMVARATGNTLTTEFVAAWRAFITGGYDSDAYIAALGGDVPAVEAAWAPSLLHSPEWGDAWDTPGIGVPTGAQPTAVHDTMAIKDVPFQVNIVPYGAVVDSESTITDGLVEISIDNGLASVHDLGSADALDFKDQLFCIDKACADSGLTCPGSPKEVKPIPLTVPFFVAAGGSAQPGILTMENISAPDTPSTPMQLPQDAGSCTPVGPRRPPSTPQGRVLRRRAPHSDPQRWLLRLPRSRGVHACSLRQWRRRRAGTR